MRSNEIIKKYLEQFKIVFSMPISTKKERIFFLREYLSLTNEFFFERRHQEEIDELNNKDDAHPNWKRITPFLSIWDDYAEKVIVYSFSEKMIAQLAKNLVSLLRELPEFLSPPCSIRKNEPSIRLEGFTAEQYCFIRLIHALQDFTNLLPEIDAELRIKLIDAFGKIPDAKTLANENDARKFLFVLGGADRNVDERVRYIYNSSRIINAWKCKTVYTLFQQEKGDAQKIYNALVTLPGLKSKKATMILRDYYELGIWKYTINLEMVDIIPDNRIMRIALRTGIIHPAMNKLLNSVIDQFDFQYMMTVEATKEAFRRVWKASKKYNNGKVIVDYPGKLDELLFRLGDGRSGCCKPNAPTCVNRKVPRGFWKWMEAMGYSGEKTSCIFENICEKENKEYTAPYAIQNNTWLEIYTNKKGGGGLRGI